MSRIIIVALLVALLTISTADALAATGGSFPNTHDAPPPEWKGPVFELSDEYPAKLPTTQNRPWEQYDFATQPRQYMESVLKYACEGNVEADWRVQNNTVRKWYHAPWMHYGKRGRDSIRGLCRQRTARPQDLHPLQSEHAQVWGISMHNELGGYTLGKVWKDPNNPDPTAALFPNGTVAIQLHFTDASLSQVPYLKNSLSWQVHIHEPVAKSTKRIVRPVRLIQFNIAVRDIRNNSRTGWVFGTFVYDGDKPGKTVWDRLRPVGLMWGNDPGVTPAMVAAGHKLKETWINPDIHTPQHLGWAGRLNGPIDKHQSSCLSCHSGAQTPIKSWFTPKIKASDNEKLRWFNNIASGESFDEACISTDYSIQTAKGIDFMQRAREDSAKDKAAEPAPADAKTKDASSDKGSPNAAEETAAAKPKPEEGETRPKVRRSSTLSFMAGGAAGVVLAGVIIHKRMK